MSRPFHKLREDLVVSRQSSDGTTSFVLKDPASGRFFRFRELEYLIAQQFDGDTSPERLQQRVQEQLGSPFSRENLEQFRKRLDGLGLLETEVPETPHAPPVRGRIGGSLFYLRLKAFDPDRLLGTLAVRLRFVFSPAFLIFSAALILLAAFTAAANGSAIARDFSLVLRPQTLLWAYLTVLLVITIHEFSHGITCKHFGGSVHDLGFLLLYFQPAFYCNVSDAWLFPERSKRLWVTLAGAYSELLVWASATLVWRVVEPGTALSFMALVVMVTSGVRTLFNLNPLIKLDGYYLLSDGVRIPNLRKKAFAFLRDRVRRLLGVDAARTDAPSRREKRIFLIYGILAATYSSWLFGIVAFYMGRALVRNYQGWGFLAFVGLLGAVLSRPVRNTMHGLRAAPENPPQRRRWIGRLVMLALLGVAAAALFFVQMQLRVSGEFTVLPVRNAEVRSALEAIVEQVYVDEGSAIHDGDPIVLLSDRDLNAELHMLDAEIEEKQARLRMYQAGPRMEEVQVSITAVEKAGDRLAYTRSQLARSKSLYDDGLLSKDKLEEAEEQVSVRQKELEDAQGRLKVLQAGSRPEEIEAMGAEITRLTANRSYVLEKLRSVHVNSPIAGVVTTPKLKEMIGRQVKKGDLIAQVNSLSTVMVEIAVPEQEISDVKIGQSVVLRARALPDVSFTGSVTSISPTVAIPGEGQIERTVKVSTLLDNSSFRLKPEMTGNAKILCGRQRLIDLVTRRLSRYLRVEFWSWW
jgi:putative peptide zinc metalloprotease protein